jgi:Aldo/keto reductase family
VLGLPDKRSRQTSEQDVEVEVVMTTRREFLELTAATVVTATWGHTSWGAESKGDVPYRTLGRTGEKVSIVGIGGYHLAKPGVDPQEATQIVHKALDEGINFLDNCWDYNGGESEVRMGHALSGGYRNEAFLMTKIDGRDEATATKQINDSLRRLQTDRIDLLRFTKLFASPIALVFFR